MSYKIELTLILCCAMLCLAHTGSPKNLKANEINRTSVNLHWELPWIFNDALKAFI